jgi:hypothetical protein
MTIKVMIRTDTVLFKRIDELDSLDSDNIKIIEIIIKEIKYEVD